MTFQGNTALITGASRGIGRAIALELARCGVSRFILVARNPQRLAEVVAEVQRLGAEAIALPLDLTRPVEVSIAIAQAWRDHGPIHLLVNCAGVAYQTPFLHSRLNQVQDEIATNLLGTYTVTRLIAKRMAAQRFGTIINVSSLMGKIGAPTMATYSATKFALLGFTQALRNELAPHQVRVVAVLPTLTDTDMVREMHWFRWVVPIRPDQVAIALVRGLQQGKSEILVGWQSHLAVWANRMVPGLVDRVIQLASPSPRPAPPRLSRSPQVASAYRMR
ncbi:MAG: SDR family oxidoreductase [Synechococcales bacterium]|nr:SDR family oxidoreductase [Synechococcales bacterium]